MPSFRDFTPKRRNITSAVAKASDHKHNLKIDFQNRCGYCNALDTWKKTYYEVDHFIPEFILTIKSITDYSNLVYSCRSCNNAKRKQWPTNDENVCNSNNEGFIDPCDNDYLNHFSRKDTGEISFNSKLGKWMYYALKLHKPHHQIIWQLEQLEPIIEEIKSLVNNENIKAEVKDWIIKTYDKYTDYVNQWRSL